MDRSEDRIPTVGAYRGVAIHAFQPPERIGSVVKPAIDDVYEISDPVQLVSYVEDNHHPPEARLFAAARVEAAWQLAAEGRANRPKVDIVRLRALTAGLSSLKWICRTHYTTMLDPYHRTAIPRETPIAQAQVSD